MNLRPRRLFTKILLWFLLTVALTSAVVFVLTGFIGPEPFGRRWMAVTQDLYAGSAADFYATGGDASLRRYLETIHRESNIDGHLLHANGTDVLGDPLPPVLIAAYERSLSTGRSNTRFVGHWTAASTVLTSGGERFVFVMETHPLRNFFDGTFAKKLLPRLLVGLLVIAVFCFILARHLTQPIRLLETAALQLSSGDLSVRTSPAMGQRSDELSRMASAFDTMAERIEALVVSERQTLAEISHELRSPLTRLSVSLELLRRGETDVIDSMDADIDRLNAMIGKVLELARLDMEPTAPMTASVDLVAMLHAIARDANREGRADAKSVIVDAEQGCTISGEPSLLHSCIENLVRNALQHSPADSDVELRLRCSVDAVTIEVRDSGPGVPVESLAHLFAPFYRVPDSRMARPEGTGLGLAIAERIARRHRGTLAARNAAPHGLIVTLQIPR